MIKVDFHIHTISTLKDSYFDFDINVLNQYINEMEIDCIAITNHNIFDKKQYDKEFIDECVENGIAYKHILYKRRKYER